MLRVFQWSLCSWQTLQRGLECEGGFSNVHRNTDSHETFIYWTETLALESVLVPQHKIRILSKLGVSL